ncbi:hypothetical protein NQZ68_012054 [Dissostichus eleginoides]|nr:hypothetical protein NQZ68_012054 [Dissostichus eleginoides]
MVSMNLAVLTAAKFRAMKEEMTYAQGYHIQREALMQRQGGQLPGNPKEEEVEGEKSFARSRREGTAE